MSLIDPDSELIIQSLSFPGEGTIEVTYLEKRDQSEHFGMVKTIFVDVRAAKLRQVHAELLELGQEVVDAALLAHRSPPEDLDPRRRFKNRKREVEPDSEDQDDQDDDQD